jgi:hypothetical protein
MVDGTGTVWRWMPLWGLVPLAVPARVATKYDGA